MMSSSALSEVDAAFSILPQALRDRIDKAFDAAAQQSSTIDGPPPKKRKLHDRQAVVVRRGGFLTANEDNIAPGGFIGDEGFIVDEPQGGGFVLSSDDEPQQTEMNPSRIPLSVIPSALQLLDLQPDDEDVLDVFRGAASGWDRSGRNDASESESFVERRDWHAVCAALLEPQDGREEDEDETLEENIHLASAEEEGLSSSEDDYGEPPDSTSPMDEDGEGDFHDSDDEYQELPRTKSKRRQKDLNTSRSNARSRKGPAADVDSEEEKSDNLKGLTPRQKAECRRAYALFFPDVEDNNLDFQRLMIKDVTRVAKVLKEKITAEEIIEMLEQFSTSPDKSMGLGDFERMMITARLA